MVDPLTEAENLCKRTLEVLENTQNPPSEIVKTIRSTLQDLLNRIAESKKKIMVRSPQGRGLATEVLDNASRTYEAAADFSQGRGDGKTLEEVSNRVRSLEDSVEKLEIYWKSFEYVTT